MPNKMEMLEKSMMKTASIGEFEPGDTVEVHHKTDIADKEKTKIQKFIGVCIARQRGGLRETFTVRRIVMGEGVERTFPVHSPVVDKVVVQRHGKVRRAKLFYLRELFGKKARLKNKLEEREVAEAPAEKKEN